LCYTGDMIGADEALRIGLVNAVVPHAELIPRARATAAKIAEKGPLAIAQCKRVILRGADVPLTVGNELEAQGFASLFGSAERRERVPTDDRHHRRPVIAWHEVDVAAVERTAAEDGRRGIDRREIERRPRRRGGKGSLGVVARDVPGGVRNQDDRASVEDDPL